jgi:hypothetical protein
VLAVADAQVVTFGRNAKRLTVEKWLEILEGARASRAGSLFNSSVTLSVKGLIANERIAAIVRTLEASAHA